MDSGNTLKGITSITILDNTTPDPVTLATFTNLKNGMFKPSAAFNEYEEEHDDGGAEGGIEGLRATGEFTWDEVDLSTLDDINTNTVATIKADFLAKGKTLTATIATGDLVVANVADGKASIKLKQYRPAGATFADIWQIAPTQ